MFLPRLTDIAHRGRVELHELDVLALVPPTEDILYLERVWKLHEHTSPLVMLELWRPTDEFDKFIRQWLLDFGRRVLAAERRRAWGNASQAGRTR
jgi:hypothetical protein